MQANPVRTRINVGGAGVAGGGTFCEMMLQLFVALTDAESRTRAVNAMTPAPDGVPVTAPVEAVRLKPGGSDPVIENAYGGVPPEATNAELYATPTWPVLA